MPVHLAQHAGFCYGVRGAMQLAKKALAEGPIETLGPLIHNPQAIHRLEQEGVTAVAGMESLCGKRVVIRSHGVGKAVYEELAARGIDALDATCPHVRRSQQLVQEAGLKGIPVVIIGAADHPEVIGIAGWAAGPVDIVKDEKQAQALPQQGCALVVTQTTMPHAKAAKIIEALRGQFDSLQVEDTICSATENRQKEATALAQSNDAMLVVGGKNSANTKELYDTVRAICPRTLWIEETNEIPLDFFRPGEHIGITAGASTPDWLLEEVITRMNDMERNDQAPEQTPDVNQEESVPMDQAQSDFMADIEATLVKIRPGQTVTGTVVQVSDDEVCVNIGYKSDGLVKRSDLTDQNVNVGDEIEVEVIKVNDGEGNVVLSQRNIVNRKQWDALMEKYDAGEYVEGVGKEAVKGGLIANVDGVRAFIPASQLSLRYVEKIDEFVGKDMTLKIIEVDKAKKRIVASYKAYLQEEAAEKKKEVWARLHVGDVVHGIVRRLTDFGAFVDIGGVDGLVHVTDLHWGRVKHPSDVVSVNQEIDVVILSLDADRERIQLGYKQLQKQPWDDAAEKYPVGSIVEGKVVRITTFGAFVELEPGLDGLVHISQISRERIAKVEDGVKVGQEVRVKVLGVDPEAKRISLSIREALEDEEYYGEEMPEGSDAEVVMAAHVETAPEATEDQAASANAAEQVEPAQAESIPAHENPAEHVSPSDEVQTPDPQDPPAVIPVPDESAGDSEAE